MALNFAVVNLGRTGPSQTPLDSIPQSVRDEVEEAWAYFSGDQYKEDTGLSVEFPDKQAKLQWIKNAQAYAAVRPEDKGPALNLRVSPMRNNPENVLVFRMRTQAEADKLREENARIRAAAAAANKNGKK